ncbi:hypothetical protein [Dokdonella sp.]|uniref:hypothetical protein n=1 Tax=Dokdonella sp. TaxID=2291710 RepID=UPI001B191F81|nr:hypothetical protein [Dokdonella sp.]MBO9663729.1 hypothetical protein [Dokdonella sp.]
MNTTIRRTAFGALLALALDAVAHAQTSPPQNGDPDTFWGNGGFVTPAMGAGDWDTLSRLAVQPGGKLVLAGACYTANLEKGLCATRLLPDGSFDVNFGEVGNGRELFAGDPRFPGDSDLGYNGLALQADNRLVMATFGHLGSDSSAVSYEGRLIRLSADGVPQALAGGAIYAPVVFADNVPAASANNAPQAVAIAPDGKIVVAGNASRAGQPYINTDWGIARFNADLGVDTSFNASGRKLVSFDLGGNFSDQAMAVAVQADRKIVVAGHVTIDGGARKAALIRLNADGSLDSGFGSGGRVFLGAATDAWSVYALAIDSQGRIVFAGSISRSAVAAQPADFFVARLGANGQADAGFGTASTDGPGVVVVHFGLSSPARDGAGGLALRGDDVFAIGSATSFYNPIGGYGDYRFALAHLRTDGSLAADFSGRGTAFGTFSPGGAANGCCIAIVGGFLFVAGQDNPSDSFFPRFAVGKLGYDRIFANGFDAEASR